MIAEFIKQYPLTTFFGIVLILLIIVFIFQLIEWREEDKFWDEILEDSQGR